MKSVLLTTLMFVAGSIACSQPASESSKPSSADLTGSAQGALPAGVAFVQRGLHLGNPTAITKAPNAADGAAMLDVMFADGTVLLCDRSVGRVETLTAHDGVEVETLALQDAAGLDFGAFRQKTTKTVQTGGPFSEHSSQQTTYTFEGGSITTGDVYRGFDPGYLHEVVDVKLANGTDLPLPAANAAGNHDLGPLQSASGDVYTFARGVVQVSGDNVANPQVADSTGKMTAFPDQVFLLGAAPTMGRFVSLTGTTDNGTFSFEGGSIPWSKATPLAIHIDYTPVAWPAGTPQ
jgi:hypothetical protein